MLIAYLARIRGQMVEAFRHRQLLYQLASVFGKPKGPAPQPPKLPGEEGGE